MTNTGEYKQVNASDDYIAPNVADARSWISDDANIGPIGAVPTVGSHGNEYVQEFTNGCARLGWLPTTTYIQGSNVPQISALPKLFMGMLVLPLRTPVSSS